MLWWFLGFNLQNWYCYTTNVKVLVITEIVKWKLFWLKPAMIRLGLNLASKPKTSLRYLIEELHIFFLWTFQYNLTLYPLQVLCVRSEFHKLKKPSLLKACRLTVQKALYLCMIVACGTRGLYYSIQVRITKKSHCIHNH